MATISSAEAHLYHVGINGVGYVLATEFGAESLTYQESYRKIGRDLIVERQDFSNDLSENKQDDLFHSGQRSFFNGAGQRRLDDPRFSDDEKFLRGKNIDPFTERGKLSLSHAISTQVAASASGSQSEGFAATSANYLYWVRPISGNTTEVEIASIQNWGDTPSVRGFDANWPAGEVVSGMANDGKYIYVANTGNGIWRGDQAQQTTALTQWSTNGTRDIAIVKDRLLGHTVNAGQVEIREYAFGSTPTENVVKTYEEGWTIREDTGHQSVFADIGGYACWVMTRGSDGYLWMWDGDNPAFQAARFPGWQAWGVVSYADSILYIVGRNPAGAPFDDRWAIIRCNASASGNVDWDVLHTLDDLPRSVGGVQNTEVFIPIRLEQEDWSGLTSDSGVDESNQAYTVASLNVASDGLLPAKHWGLTDSNSISGLLWGDSGFAQPDIATFRSALALVGENGEIRAEQTSHAPTGELLSSLIDYNIDADKVYLNGSLAAEPLEADVSITLQFTDDDPETESPTFIDIGTISTAGESQIDGRPGPDGTQTDFLLYRVQLASSTGVSTPFVRKASLGAVYSKKPKVDHLLLIKAYEEMTLRNDQPFPGNRPPDTIQGELESLWENQTVFDYQEPILERGVRSSVKAQIREFEVIKRWQPNLGAANVVRIRVKEV